MERIEDRSKALSYIGIEVADALKSIPTPVENTEIIQEETEQVQENVEQAQEVQEQTVEKVKTAKTKKKEKAENVQKVEEVAAEQKPEEKINEQVQAVEETKVVKPKKPSLWQRIKNSKLVRSIKYVMKIKVVLDYPALPEGRGENN